MAYTKLSNGWVLTLAPPISEVLSCISKLTTIISIVIIIGIALSIIVALYLGKKISEPIKVATEHTAYSQESLETIKMLISIVEDEKATITNGNSGENKLYLHIYIAKIILHYNSKNIARILDVIVNCEMRIVNCKIHTIESKQEFVDKGYFEVIEGCKTLREKTLT